MVRLVMRNECGHKNTPDGTGYIEVIPSTNHFADPSGMRYLAALALVLGVSRATTTTPSGPQGIDVSDWQPTINWTAVVDNGIQFVYIKATEGTSSVIQFAARLCTELHCCFFSLYLAHVQ